MSPCKQNSAIKSFQQNLYRVFQKVFFFFHVLEIVSYASCKTVQNKVEFKHYADERHVFNFSEVTILKFVCGS